MLSQLSKHIIHAARYNLANTKHPDTSNCTKLMIKGAQHFH